MPIFRIKKIAKNVTIAILIFNYILSLNSITNKVKMLFLKMELKSSLEVANH